MRFQKLKCPNCNKETRISTKKYISFTEYEIKTIHCKYCNELLDLRKDLVRKEDFDELIFTFGMIRRKCKSALNELTSTDDLRKVAEILKVDID